ncbi:MAG TPA: hypothetical protein VFB72_10275, partial [Verrucomicrobiae bacterium]|nr:hypothetical protein [Verrucomicrobiae bacterium]
KKIGGLLVQGRLRTPHAETASHLYFASSSSDSFFQCFSTHPPLAKRIVAIFPRFDGQFPHVKMLPVSTAEIQQRLEDSYAILAQSAATHEGMANAISSAITPEQARAISVGFRNAALVREAIPDDVLRTVHQPMGAMAFIYALLLDLDDSARAKQLKELQPNTAPGVYDQTLKLQAPVATLDERARLALIDLALPALRHLSLPQYEELMRNTEMLIESDRAIILFEYTMQKVLERHLKPKFEKSAPPRSDFRAMEPLANDCAVLLSALARMERQDDAAIENAFAAGVQQLDLRTPISLLSANECNLPQIDAALQRAAQGTLYIRRNLMYACAHTAADDGRMPGREVLLLRAIADALDCPVPPFVNAADAAQSSR